MVSKLVENEKLRIDRRLKPADLFFLMRPPMLVPVWTFFLAGYWRSMDISVKLIPVFIRNSIILSRNFWISFIAYSLLLGAIYILNQIVDRESDRKNRKLFLIPLGIVPVKLAVVVTVFLIIVSFGLTLKFGILYTVFMLISLVVGLLYSFPPTRLKGRPIVDIVSNAAGYGILAFGVGWLTAAGFSWKIFVFCIPYFFATASIFAVSTILDIKGDREDGAITTAVKFGKKPTLFISIVTLLMSLMCAFWTRDLLIIITSLVSLPLIIKAIIGKKREFITLYMRGTSYILIVLIGLLFPWYFLLLVFILLVSRYYYKHRFGIRYPELLEKEA